MGDDDPSWLKPAVAQMVRVLKADALCVSFYVCTKARLYLEACLRRASLIGHILYSKHRTKG